MKTLSSIKESKFRLNAGHPWDALTWARTELNSRDPARAAMAHHRAAMAFAALGKEAEALQEFEDAERLAGKHKPFDAFCFVLIVRDYELYKAKICALSHGSERDSFYTDCSLKVQEAVSLLEQLISEPYRVSERKIKLELLVTGAFLTRIDVLRDPMSPKRRLLEKEWQDIRKSRGLTKPIYELDALEWMLRYGEPNRLRSIYALRGFGLSFEVSNRSKLAKFTAMPGINLTSHLLLKITRRYFS